MSWREPMALAALVAVPLLAAFFAWAARARQRALDAVVAASLQDVVVAGVDGRRRRLRAGLLVAAVAALVVAIAGPEVGFTWEEVRREGVDLIVALDTSRSMLTPDVRPDRLARAKLGVRDLLAAARGDRFGLVAFAGTAFLQCPLTLDQRAFLESLDATDVGIIPRGGTNLEAAITTALDGFEGREGRHQAIVLITDGEPTEGDVERAVAKAKERGVRIFTVGIGTPAGELIPGEGGGFYKDQRGQAVKSRLDEALLEHVAVETGGVYLRAAGASLGLTELYRDHIATMERRQLGSTLARRPEERFQWPLALALALLAAEWLVGDGRAPRMAVAPAARAAAAVLLVVAGTGFLDPHAAGREGNRLYAEGRYDEAAKRYNDALVDAPDSARLHLNLGAAEYKAGHWDAARRALEAVPDDPKDPARTGRRLYDLGNVQFRQGEALEQSQPEQALQRWNEALASYERALATAPGDRDAQWNHELVQRRAAELRRRLEQQKQQQRQGGKQDQQQRQQDQQQQQQQQQDQQQAGESQPQSAQGRQPQDRPQDEQRNGSEPQEAEGATSTTLPQQAAAAPAAGEPKPGEQGAAGGAAQGGEGRMTPAEAAALLDAQREQEVSPADVLRRLAPARVAEPAKDW